MTTDEASSSQYQSGSVFCVDLLNGVQVGYMDHDPNHQSFDISVIEFHDSGSCVDHTQLRAATDCIQQARRANENGAIVVAFIHGWHHDASWDLAKNNGDAHFSAFRDVLKGLALREAERYLPEPGGRRVVGIYFGWQGDPTNSLLRRTRWLTHLSFWNRYCAAKKIGDSEDIRKTLRAIVSATKEPIEGKPESPLILVGHSMGALILESAFLSLLNAEDEPLIRQRGQTSGEGCVEIQQHGAPISFPDILIALNSAADSRIVKGIKAALKKQGLTKTLVADNINYSPPLLISLTSSADSDTNFFWRLAQFPQLWRKTDGHDSSLFTHTFGVEKIKVSCEPEGFVNFGQNWHCLRAPRPPLKPTPSFAIDLPTRARDGIADKPDHDRFRLAPLRDADCSYPAWVFQVPPRIVANHNDIFNSLSSALIMALIQISGAVMSLATDVRDNFKDETL